MAALPALVRALRYGDVRGTDTGALAEVAEALIIRICAGLPAAVSSLADDAAAACATRLDAVHAAVGLHAQSAGEAERDRWLAVLAGLAGRRDLHGLLAGRVTRMLVDSQELSQAEAARRFAAHLSVGPTAADKAAWAEGFLAGSGLLLVHDREPADRARRLGRRPGRAATSWTCCRCCAGPSPGSPPASGPTWAAAVRQLGTGAARARPRPSRSTSERAAAVLRPSPRSWAAPGDRRRARTERRAAGGCCSAQPGGGRTAAGPGRPGHRRRPGRAV